MSTRDFHASENLIETVARCNECTDNSQELIIRDNIKDKGISFFSKENVLESKSRYKSALRKEQYVSTLYKYHHCNVQ